MAASPSLTIRRLEASYAVCRLPPDSPAPPLEISNGDIVCVARTRAELSVVCPEERAPEGARIEGPWTALEVVGPLDLSLVGVLADLTTTLADAGVSIFAISTFETDYLLVRDADASPAIAALSASGHRLIA
jgi:hypothetical protein